jgi:hypothetical protein
MSAIYQQLLRLEQQNSRIYSQQLHREYSRLYNKLRVAINNHTDFNNLVSQFNSQLSIHNKKIREITRINSHRFLKGVADNMAQRTDSSKQFISKIKQLAASISTSVSTSRTNLVAQRTAGWAYVASNIINEEGDIAKAKAYLQERFAGGIGSRRSVIIANDVLQTSGNQLIQGIGNEAENQDDNLEIIKVWMTQRDSKVRSGHKDAHGQEVLNNENFDVDGESLRFPGDPLGSPGNTINCRCFMRLRKRKRQRRNLDE